LKPAGTTGDVSVVSVDDDPDKSWKDMLQEVLGEAPDMPPNFTPKDMIVYLQTKLRNANTDKNSSTDALLHEIQKTLATPALTAAPAAPALTAAPAAPALTAAPAAPATTPLISENCAAKIII
jgi:hypothetical protein